VIISGIFGLGAFNFSFVLLRSQDFGIAQVGDISLVYAAINITHTSIGIPAGMLADKIGKEKVLVIGYSVFIISVLLMVFPISEQFLYGYIIAAVFGLYIGIIETVQRAVIPRYVRSEMRGTAFGLYYMVIGLSFFFCNIVFGSLWDIFSFNTAASYSLGLSATAIVGMLLFIKRYVISSP
ncbi:MAG TPA: MFS transporter, partial [Nitrososphaeraceae archaeon]|nr:MFS transporter [Nitrososphaeraceae archaeon]